MNYKKRLLREYSDLNDKVKKLDSFLSNKRIEISLDQEELMKKQLEIMKDYLKVLEERILLEMGDINA